MGAANPEIAGQLGVDGLDEQIVDLKPGFSERTRAGIRKAAATLKERLATENDARVRQDLEILIKAAEDNVRSSELGDKFTVNVPNLTQLAFSGVRALLDDQIPEKR